MLVQISREQPASLTRCLKDLGQRELYTARCRRGLSTLINYFCSMPLFSSRAGDQRIVQNPSCTFRTLIPVAGMNRGPVREASVYAMRSYSGTRRIVDVEAYGARIPWKYITPLPEGSHRHAEKGYAAAV